MRRSIGSFRSHTTFCWGGGPDSALLVILMRFALTCSLLIATVATLRRTVREQAVQERRILDLHGELQHRVANTLSIVEAMALQTLNSSGSDKFKKAFVGPLHALARANRVLGTGETGTCDMRGLAEKAIEPFCTLGNITLEGPNYQLPNNACTPLTLALHELCTNATKYGALSVPGGTVILTWRLEGTNGVAIWWIETGGPVVAPPARKGLGSKLLVPQASITSVQVDYRPEGLWCEIKIAES